MNSSHRTINTGSDPDRIPDPNYDADHRISVLAGASRVGGMCSIPTILLVHYTNFITRRVRHL